MTSNPLSFNPIGLKENYLFSNKYFPQIVKIKLPHANEFELFSRAYYPIFLFNFYFLSNSK
jgi:hypothetical protein